MTAPGLALALAFISALRHSRFVSGPIFKKWIILSALNSRLIFEPNVTDKISRTSKSAGSFWESSRGGSVGSPECDDEIRFWISSPTILNLVLIPGHNDPHFRFLFVLWASFPSQNHSEYDSGSTYASSNQSPGRRFGIGVVEGK